MTRAHSLIALVAGGWLCAPGIAFAQGSSTQSRSDRVEVSVGGVWFGSSTFAEVESTQITPSGSSATVATTSTSLDTSMGLAARVGVALTSRLAAEGAVSLNPTHLTTSVTDDVENFADPSATEPLTQYLFEAGVRWRLGAVRNTGFAPFLSAGGGYLRQLHDQQTLASTGRSFYVGGGGHYVFHRGTRWIRSSGFRVDLRMALFSDGAATDEAVHAVPSAGAGLFIRF